MRVITAPSVNQALFHGCYHLANFGLVESSRNGQVVVSRAPVTTVYTHPRNRVLICEVRDPNPFFHLFESLWMLAGRNDLAFLQQFVSTFGQFSDDGETLHGAYGYRWRNWFGYDQLALIIEELKANPKTRRAVLSMWDGGNGGKDVFPGDLNVGIHGGKDVPCNTHAYFDTIGGVLNMTVCCRSNDMILGAYGANAVHFSILLEYMAAAVGMPMGVLRQISNNFHAYTDLYPHIIADVANLAPLGTMANDSDPYGQPGPLRTKTFDTQKIYPVPLLAPGESAAHFMQEAEWFCDHTTEGNFGITFFNFVVGPMYKCWLAWKSGDFDGAKHLALQIRADDWRLAAQSWLSIRELRRAVKENAK